MKPMPRRLDGFPFHEDRRNDDRTPSQKTWRLVGMRWIVKWEMAPGLGHVDEGAFVGVGDEDVGNGEGQRRKRPR